MTIHCQNGGMRPSLNRSSALRAGYNKVAGSFLCEMLRFISQAQRNARQGRCFLFAFPPKAQPEAKAAYRLGESAEGAA